MRIVFMLRIMVLTALCGWSCTGGGPEAPAKEPYIQLQPFTGTKAAQVAAIARCLEEQWGMPCRISSPVDAPREAYVRTRQRYSAEALLRFLGERKESGARWILGILPQDIETPRGEGGWGIMGLARLRGPAAVISSFRPSRGRIPEALLQRRMNILAQHELGHCAGLDHCADTTCILQDARGKMRLDFSSGFCSRCEYYWRRNGPVSRTYSQHAENKEKNTPLKFL